MAAIKEREDDDRKSKEMEPLFEKKDPKKYQEEEEVLSSQKVPMVGYGSSFWSLFDCRGASDWLRCDRPGIATIACSAIMLTIFALPWSFSWLKYFGQEAFPEDSRPFSQSPLLCDYTNGSWVIDDSFPLYTSCSFLTKHNCSADGRTDNRYQKLRWRPHDCAVTPFDLDRLVESLKRIKRRRTAVNGEFATLAFVGDSLNQNMFLSMGCMIEAAHGRPSHNKVSGKTHTHVLEWKSIGLRVKYFKCPYLVALTLENNGKEIAGSKERKEKDTVGWELHVDRVASVWKERIADVDLIIINSGHWWVPGKLASRKIVFAKGGRASPSLSLFDAFRIGIETVTDHMMKKMKSGEFKGELYIRSYSPHHFSRGDWNTGGRCDTNLALSDEQVKVHRSSSMKQMGNYNVVLNSVYNQTRTKCPTCPVYYLQITELSDYRPDAHPSHFKPGVNDGREDCSHWCLPGLPDTWNELLLFSLENNLGT